MKMTTTKIKNIQCAVILPHVMPDGDTVGSCVALSLGLGQLGITSYIVLDDALPRDIAFMAVDLGVHIYTLQEFEALNVAYDTAMSVDLSDLERLGPRKRLLFEKVVWNIDHHITNLKFGHVQVVDTYASATGEIIFALLKENGVTLTQPMAEALYVAISSDTGSFKYSNTTPRTHRIIAEILEVGIRRDFLSLHLYHSEPPSKLKLHALSLAQLHIYDSGHIARAYVSQEMLSQTQAQMSESDGLVERIRDIEHIDTVLLLKETGVDETKVSMRSIGGIDLSAVALRHGGGGHKNAAGFTLKMPLNQALKYIDKLIADDHLTDGFIDESFMGETTC